jgi:predicted HTH transcriptional regulator
VQAQQAVVLLSSSVITFCEVSGKCFLKAEKISILGLKIFFSFFITTPIFSFLRENEKITNKDVENLCNVSDATATRYLDELEKEEKIKQIGTTGPSTYYRLR